MMTLDQTAPELEVVTELDGAWRVRGAATRLNAVRRAALSLRERFASEPPVESVGTFDLLTLAYPVRWGYWGAAMVPVPYVLLRHRALLVQFRQRGELRNLLFNPTLVEGVLRAPYVEAQRKRKGLWGRMSVRVHEALEPQLSRGGIAPDDIDYVAFDHLHLQDVRGLVGKANGTAPRFPRARLLVSAAEWDEWDSPIPFHAAFYVPRGKDGVDPDRIVRLERDVRLGNGVYLVRTPGHTAGHQTLFFKTDRGVWATSDNGISADNWAPRASRIRSLSGRAKDQGLEVLMNVATPENGLDQYTSMVLEKTVVDPAREDADFPQIFPSFEATASVLTPGMTPFTFGRVEHGRRIRSSERGTKAPLRPIEPMRAHPG